MEKSNKTSFRGVIVVYRRAGFAGGHRQFCRCLMAKEKYETINCTAFGQGTQLGKTFSVDDHYSGVLRTE